MEPKTKKKYSKEFKIQALDLVKSTGSYSEAARQLWISDSLLHSWRRTFNFSLAPAANKNAAQSFAEAEEVKRLRKEIDELKKVNYILKKAAAFFTQDHLK
jgi:transposase